MLIALWDVSDQTFGSSKRANVVDSVSRWLFDAFGHWGPRLVLIAVGTLLLAWSFWLVSLPRADEALEQPSGTARSVLSWALVLLVSLLAFALLAPRLRNPTLDGLLSDWWQSPYPLLTISVALLLVLGMQLRWHWEDFRETGDPWNLLRPATYAVLAIIVVLFFLWRAIAFRP